MFPNQSKSSTTKSAKQYSCSNNTATDNPQSSQTASNLPTIPTPSNLPSPPLQPPPVPTTIRQPKHPRNYPRPKNWTGKWCSHHGSLTHNIDQCYELQGNRRPEYPPYQDNMIFEQQAEDHHQDATMDHVQLRLQQLENALTALQTQPTYQVRTHLSSKTALTHLISNIQTRI